MSTFKFETKNKEVKQYSKSFNQRINLPLSLSYKSAMRFNTIMLDHKLGLPPIVSHESAKLTTYIKIKSSDYFKNISLEMQEIFEKNEIFLCKNIMFKETIYKKEYFIISEFESPKECYEIIELIFVNSNYYVIVKVFSIISYEPHYRSYKLGNFLKKYVVFESQNIVSLPFNVHKNVQGKSFIRLKHI